MIIPLVLPLVAQRWTPFVDTSTFKGLDLTGATMAMQVRLYRDAPGSAILSLTNAISSAEGLSISVATIDGIVWSTLQIRINETTLEAILLNQGKAGSDVALVYDLHLTGGGLPKSRVFEGPFTIRAGATQNV